MTTKSKIHESLNNIHRVVAELGISAKGKFEGKYANSPQFNYQKTDDIYEFISPLLANENIICLPFVIDAIETVEQTSNGRLIRTKVTVEYTFTHIEDGSFVKVRTIGEDTDTGGRSSAKAMTAAHKIVLKQMFLIPKKGNEQQSRNDSNTQQSNNNVRSVKPVKAAQQNIRTVHSEVAQNDKNISETKALTKGQISWLTDQVSLVGMELSAMLNHYKITDLSQLSLSDYEPLRKRIIELRKQTNSAQ